MGSDLVLNDLHTSVDVYNGLWLGKTIISRIISLKKCVTVTDYGRKWPNVLVLAVFWT